MAAAEFADLWLNQLYMNASTLGEFPAALTERLAADGVLWETSSEELQLIKDNTIDYLGVNFYHPHRVKAPEVSPDSLAVDWLHEKYFVTITIISNGLCQKMGWAFPGRNVT